MVILEKSRPSASVISYNVATCAPIPFGGAGADRMPAIAVPRRPAQRGARMAADPDRRMGLLQRERFGADVGVAVELSLEARRRGGPELLEDREPLVGHRAAPVEVGAVQRLEIGRASCRARGEVPG